MKIKGAETKLEESVQRTINASSDGDPEGWIADLMQGGCQSGHVGSLIYYTDTVKFYKAHRAEIDGLLRGLCADCGNTPAQLFGDKWDADDFFARDTQNQNLLAWFGFEETARKLADRNGIEV